MNPQAAPLAHAPSAIEPALHVLLDAIGAAPGVNPVHVIGACIALAGQFASQLHLQGPAAELLRACAGELEAEAAANRTLQ